MRPEPRVNADAVEVDLRANLPDVTFHVETGTASFEGVGYGWNANGGLMTTSVSGTANSYSVICSAPCTATLPAGTHRLLRGRGRRGYCPSTAPLPGGTSSRQMRSPAPSVLGK